MDAIVNNMVDLGLHYMLFKASNTTRLNICFEETPVIQIGYSKYFAFIGLYLSFLARYIPTISFSSTIAFILKV